MTQPINPHEHDEDPEEHIGDEVPDPWGGDDEEVNQDGHMDSSS